jgi:hypothetical protein
MRAVTIGSIGCVVGIVACHRSSAPAPATEPSSPAQRPAGAVQVQQRDMFVSVGSSFRPLRGDSALRAFTPDVAADESGGECSINRTGGSGATAVIAWFPARNKSHMQVTVMFDSSGRLVRYFERRGGPDMSRARGMKAEQVDSLVRAEEAKARSTSITLDYAIDQGIAINRGAGKPTAAIMGTVRQVESLEKLGPPSARLDRVRKLCGV